MKIQFVLLFLILSFVANAQNAVRCDGDTCTLVMHSDKASLKRIVHGSVKRNDKGLTSIVGEKIVGFCTADGKMIIPYAYDYANSFFKGYAVVGIKDQQGIIDSTGKLVIPLKYYSLSNFSEGFAFFSRTGDKIDGMVDLSGKEKLLDASVGKTRMRVGGVSFMNMPINGARYMITIPPLISAYFSEGFAVIDGYKVVDKEGKQVFVSTHSISDCKDGMFRIRKQLSTGEVWYGFVNTKGIVVVQPIYRDAENFSNGKALVTSGSPAKPIKKYINKFGAVVEIVK